MPHNLFDEKIDIEWRIQALPQISIRNISRKDRLEIVFSGEVIESYPDDSPYPSFLLYGCVNVRPLHVVLAHAEKLHVVYIVTAYEPDRAKWEDNYRRRK
jgi:hypothetical protein